MARSTQDKIADALKAAYRVVKDHVVQSKELRKTDLMLPHEEGYLKQITRGWYLLDADTSSREAGTSARWYESYWHFIGLYLDEMVGPDY